MSAVDLQELVDLAARLSAAAERLGFNAHIAIHGAMTPEKEGLVDGSSPLVSCHGATHTVHRSKHHGDLHVFVSRIATSHEVSEFTHRHDPECPHWDAPSVAA